MDIKETYNQIADDWHKDHQTDDWWVGGTDAFIKMLEPGSLVLDVGCAGGVKSRYLIDRGLRVFGIDVAEKFIDIAKREVPEASFAVMDMQNVTSLPAEFDGVFMQASLLHIPKKQAAQVVATLAAKLVPGGVFYVAVKEIYPGGIEEEVKTEHDYGYPYQRFFSYYSVDEIKGYLTALGLEIVWTDILPTGKTNWIQVIASRVRV